jgi:hypothetical protein
LSSFTASDSSSTTSFSTDSDSSDSANYQPQQQQRRPHKVPRPEKDERPRERSKVQQPEIYRAASADSSVPSSVPPPPSQQQQQQQHQPPVFRQLVSVSTSEQPPQRPSVVTQLSQPQLLPKHGRPPALPSSAHSSSLSSHDGGDTNTTTRPLAAGGGSSSIQRGTISGGGGSIILPNRARCDTGDVSKTSHTTNTSRHRRQGPHRFSQFSMERILDGTTNATTTRTTTLPPKEVVLKNSDGRPLRHSLPTSPGQQQKRPLSLTALAMNRSMVSGEDSGYISPLEDEDDDEDKNVDGSQNRVWVGREVGYTTNHPPFHNTNNNINNAQTTSVGEEDIACSPFAQLQQQQQRRKGEPGQVSDDDEDDNDVEDEVVDAAPKTQRQQRPPATPRNPFVPMYLRKSPLFEEQLSKQHHQQVRVIISGWIAVVLGEKDSFEQRYQAQPKRIVALPDLYYLRLVVDDSTGRASLNLYQPAAGTTLSYPLQPGWLVQSREVSSRHGRCVLVRQAGVGTTPALSLALLPVSTPDGLFASPTIAASGSNVDKGILVSQAVFAKRRQQLFVPKGGRSAYRAYAPDEQQDAAMFLMFSLDAWIKNSPLE